MKTLIILSAIFLLPFTTLCQQPKIPYDKQLHFLAGGMITSSTYIILNRFEMPRKQKIFLSIGAGFGAGILKEVYDVGLGKDLGYFDLKDILATSLGSISIIIPIGKRF